MSENELPECVDARKDTPGFPCGMRTVDGRCTWKGEKACEPIKVDWYVVRNADALAEVKL